MINQVFRAELLDKNNIVKCNLEIVGGSINCSSKLSIQLGGTLRFKYPDVSYKVESSPPPITAIIKSTNKRFILSADETGVLTTSETLNTLQGAYLGNIKVGDDGILYTNDGAKPNPIYDLELRDMSGIFWDVGVDTDMVVITKESDKQRYVEYKDVDIEINWLTDRVKIYFNDKSLGIFAMTTPKRDGDFISTDMIGINLIIQRKRPLDSVVFKKDTNYMDVLQYFIITAGQVKFNIEQTDLKLPSDLVIDNSKNNLEWFNYVADQINYTHLQVDSNGYFTSKKYIKPSPLNVAHTYFLDETSVIVGGFDVAQDVWGTSNIIRCVVARSDRPIMYATARNDDPTDEFSTYNIGEVLEVVNVENVATQAELDLLASKLLFEKRQVKQNVKFSTLIEPHGIDDVIQIHDDIIGGVYVESEWEIPLVGDVKMYHTVSRLVDIREVVI